MLVVNTTSDSTRSTVPTARTTATTIQPQQYAPQSGQLTSQPNCGQCPPGYRPAYGTSGGSVNVFKATIILEDCPPCPPGYISTNGISQPQNFPQQNSNSYNYAQQPHSAPPTITPITMVSLAVPPTTTSKATTPTTDLQPQITSNNQDMEAHNPTIISSPEQPPRVNWIVITSKNCYQENDKVGKRHYPSLSFPQGTPSAQQQGSFGYSNNQPGQQQSFTGQTQSNQPLLSSSTSYGGFQPPYYGGAYGQGEQAGGGQPGYLPNYHGDTYTNPQRTQETRALNDPFYQSIGGEPRYPGGDVNTPKTTHPTMPSCLIPMLIVVAGSLSFGQSVAQEGAWFPLDVNSDKAKEVAQHGVDAFNGRSNDAYYHPLVRILDAESQVVNGFNYAVHIIIGKSKCKNEQSAKYSCKPTDNSGDVYLVKTQQDQNGQLSYPELTNISAVNKTQELQHMG
uniref:Cystatin domain-containing protein n=1 Tax=Ditylenchus dipsaci TaxID=166011 RepID=A0A915EV71_9BILA